MSMDYEVEHKRTEGLLIGTWSLVITHEGVIVQGTRAQYTYSENTEWYSANTKVKGKGYESTQKFSLKHHDGITNIVTPEDEKYAPYPGSVCCGRSERPTTFFVVLNHFRSRFIERQTRISFGSILPEIKHGDRQQAACKRLPADFLPNWAVTSMKHLPS